MKDPVTPKQVKINEATITLREDGIVYVLFHKNVTLDLALQMLMLNIYNEVAGNRKRPFLIEAMKGVKVSKEAKDNALRIESEAPGLAYAVIADSFVYKVIANFYLTIKTPRNPYKVFSKKEEAVKWLQGFIQ